MPAGQLHIDLRERVSYAIAKIDETIVDTDSPEDQRDNNREEDQKCTHCSPP